MMSDALSFILVLLKSRFPPPSIPSWQMDAHCSGRMWRGGILLERMYFVLRYNRRAQSFDRFYIPTPHGPLLTFTMIEAIDLSPVSLLQAPAPLKVSQKTETSIFEPY